jgi:CTP:molybdopterin cytidylyltransferase MocA
MGTPKALLDARGKTFLARILDSLREGGAGPVIVVTRSLEDLVAKEAEKLGSEVILNPDPSKGPVSSLQAGIRHLSGDAPAVLFAPVDHPLFSPKTVQALIAGFMASNAPLVVPAFEGWRGHPVLFSRSLFPELLEKDLPEGARTVVRRYLRERLQLTVDDPGILADIDTPEEYLEYFP